MVTYRDATRQRGLSSFPLYMARNQAENASSTTGTQSQLKFGKRAKLKTDANAPTKLTRVASMKRVGKLCLLPSLPLDILFEARNRRDNGLNTTELSHSPDIQPSTAFGHCALNAPQ